MKHLYLLILSFILCSCVSYTYRFELQEPGATTAQLHGDSLLICTVMPRFAASSNPSARVEIVRGGARSIFVNDFRSEMIWGEKEKERRTGGGLDAAYIDPHQNLLIPTSPYATIPIEELEPEFRTLDEAGGVRVLQLEHSYGYLPHNVDAVTLRIHLDLLIDGAPHRIDHTIPLRVESKAHWGTLRVAH